MPRALIDTGRPLHQEADDAWEALVDANDPDDPTLMVRGNALVRLTEQGRLEDFSLDSLRYELSRVAQFTRTSARGITMDVDPPKDVVQVLLTWDSARYEGAPRVDRVVDVPVVGGSGQVLDRPGHHAEDRIYYRPDPLLGQVVPGSIETTDDVQRARDFLLEELLGDFDFAEVADQAH